MKKKSFLLESSKSIYSVIRDHIVKNGLIIVIYEFHYPIILLDKALHEVFNYKIEGSWTEECNVGFGLFFFTVDLKKKATMKYILLILTFVGLCMRCSM